MQSQTNPVPSNYCRSTPTTGSPAPVPDAVVADKRGEVEMRLRRRRSDLLLEIEERRNGEPSLMVVAAFTAATAFEDWCAEDRLRFDAPLMHQQVRRHAGDLWNRVP